MSDFTAGQKPTATQFNDWLPRFKLKQADESISASTTIQSDDELFLSVAATTTYRMTLDLLFNSPAAADFKIEWSTPAGVSGYWTVTAQNLAAAAETAYQGSLSWAGQAQIEGSASDKAVLLRGLITTTNSGTLTFRWAQNSASGTTTVKANSLLTLQKIQ